MKARASAAPLVELRDVRLTVQEIPRKTGRPARAGW
jgi:hypothetical protein